jgi:hypothetical protein
MSKGVGMQPSQALRRASTCYVLSMLDTPARSEVCDCQTWHQPDLDIHALYGPVYGDKSCRCSTYDKVLGWVAVNECII